MRSLSKTPSPTQSPSYASYANDERWRIAAAYASTGTGGTASATLLERYVHHAAGQAGKGGSSYIDAVVLRDRDLDAEASSTTDGGTDPLEERTYILQNWRADVVATARRNGSVIEKMQYTAYGAAVTHLYHGTVRGDFNVNGGVDGSDLEDFELAWANGESSTDVNFDGGIDSADWDAFLVIWATGELSTDIYESHAGACQTTAVRFGYAGYVRDGSVNGERVYTDAAAGLYHVRHRAYDPELGRWTRRDPIGYVDGMSLFAYVNDVPIQRRDPSGLSPLVDCLGCLGALGAAVLTCPQAWVPCGLSVGTPIAWKACLAALAACGAQGLQAIPNCVACWNSLFGGGGTLQPFIIIPMPAPAPVDPVPASYACARSTTRDMPALANPKSSLECAEDRNRFSAACQSCCDLEREPDSIEHTQCMAHCDNLATKRMSRCLVRFNLLHFPGIIDRD